MNKIFKSIVRSAWILAVFAFVWALAVALSNHLTKEQIKENEKQFLLQKLNKIIPANSYDNKLAEDTTLIKPNSLLGTKTETTAYFARKNNRVITTVLTAIAPDGYNGEIHLLVAVKQDYSLSGVRVVKHRETVGLADGIEDTKSDWILGFDNKTLNNDWRVKKDGGEFDQFTGATITPRAIVKAIKNALIYAQQHKELFQ